MSVTCDPFWVTRRPFQHAYMPANGPPPAAAGVFPAEVAAAGVAAAGVSLAVPAAGSSAATATGGTAASTTAIARAPSSAASGPATFPCLHLEQLAAPMERTSSARMD